MKPFGMALPRTVEEAVSACAGGFRETKILAGGTDLLGELKERTCTPERLVNLKGIGELRGIERRKRGLEIGALTPLSEVAAHADVKAGWPALIETIGRTATPQLRNVGTIGGNICQRPRCWYYRSEAYRCIKKRGYLCYARNGENEYHAVFDNDICCVPHPSNCAPVLIAYGAEIEIAGPQGSRAFPIDEFFVAPYENVTAENILKANEVVTRIILPAGSRSRTSAYVEAREKQSFDWALCGSTVILRLEGGRVKRARIVLSAVAPKPLRRRDLEEMLEGREITSKRIEEVCRAAVAGATPLRQNGYKLALVRATLKRAIGRAAKGG
ncbi:MAG: FAD binding domain-containing protein [Planctomycetota bacterium]